MILATSDVLMTDAEFEKSKNINKDESGKVSFIYNNTNVQLYGVQRIGTFERVYDTSKLNTDKFMSNPSVRNKIDDVLTATSLSNIMIAILNTNSEYKTSLLNKMNELINMRGDESNLKKWPYKRPSHMYYYEIQTESETYYLYKNEVNVKRISVISKSDPDELYYTNVQEFINKLDNISSIQLKQRALNEGENLINIKNFISANKNGFYLDTNYLQFYFYFENQTEFNKIDEIIKSEQRSHNGIYIQDSINSEQDSDIFLYKIDDKISYTEYTIDVASIGVDNFNVEFSNSKFDSDSKQTTENVENNILENNEFGNYDSPMVLSFG